MKPGHIAKGFYFITDAQLSVNGILEDVRQALSAGVSLVQYREKGRQFHQRVEEAKRVLALCQKAEVPLIVNDEVSLALAVGADGVHLGQEDAPVFEARERLGTSAIIGVSVATVEQAQEAENAGADYLAASPVFSTPTKPDAGDPVGLEGLSQLRRATNLPLVAIGGIDLANVRSVVEAGADLVCAISASLAGGTVEMNIRRLLDNIDRESQ